MTQPTHGAPPDRAGLLTVLLAEQKHIDTQIETMTDLQIKILTFLFPELAAAAGWIFKGAADLSVTARGAVC